jgi:hypothetical protein
MNKAFVREPDDTGAGYCPRCGSLGVAVGAETLQAQLGDEAKQLADAAFYCPYPKCDVAYFDRFERIAIADKLAHSAYPKDAVAPICNCFGFTTAEIDADLNEGGVARTKALIAKTKTPAAHCLTAQPDGRSCAAEVQRYYMRGQQSGASKAK